LSSIRKFRDGVWGSLTTGKILHCGKMGIKGNLFNEQNFVTKLGLYQVNRRISWFMRGDIPSGRPSVRSLRSLGRRDVVKGTVPSDRRPTGRRKRVDCPRSGTRVGTVLMFWRLDDRYVRAS
jgi:hypothetical protein